MRPVRPLLVAAVLALVGEAAGADDLLRAVAAAPAVVAAARRAEAVAARVDAAGLLPDPEAEGMLSRMKGPMGERATMAELTVRQPWPRRGERAARRGLAAASAATAQAEVAEVAAVVAAEVAAALAEAESARARVALAQVRRDRLAAALAALDVRLVGGGFRLNERLGLQSRLAALEVERREAAQAEADAAAEARRLLGRAPTETLPAFAAPDPGALREDATAVGQRAAAQVAEAGALARLARAETAPLTSLGVRYERGETRMGNEDTVGLALMTDFPWRARRAAQAETRAAAANRAAGESDWRAAARSLETAVARAERAGGLAAAARSAAETTRRRLEAEAEALRALAGVGAGGDSPVLRLAELLDQATEVEVRALEAESAARLARAELWRHAPAELFSPSFLPPSP